MPATIGPEIKTRTFVDKKGVSKTVIDRAAIKALGKMPTYDGPGSVAASRQPGNQQRLAERNAYLTASSAAGIPKKLAGIAAAALTGVHNDGNPVMVGKKGNQQMAPRRRYHTKPPSRYPTAPGFRPLSNKETKELPPETDAWGAALHALSGNRRFGITPGGQVLREPDTPPAFAQVMLENQQGDFGPDPASPSVAPVNAFDSGEQVYMDQAQDEAMRFSNLPVAAESVVSLSAPHSAMNLEETMGPSEGIGPGQRPGDQAYTECMTVIFGYENPNIVKGPNDEDVRLRRRGRCYICHLRARGGYSVGDEEEPSRMAAPSGCGFRMVCEHSAAATAMEYGWIRAVMSGELEAWVNHHASWIGELDGGTQLINEFIEYVMDRMPILYDWAHYCCNFLKLHSLLWKFMMGKFGEGEHERTVFFASMVSGDLHRRSLANLKFVENKFCGVEFNHAGDFSSWNPANSCWTNTICQIVTGRYDNAAGVGVADACVDPSPVVKEREGSRKAFIRDISKLYPEFGRVRGWKRKAGGWHGAMEEEDGEWDETADALDDDLPVIVDGWGKYCFDSDGETGAQHSPIGDPHVQGWVHQTAVRLHEFQKQDTYRRVWLWNSALPTVVDQEAEEAYVERTMQDLISKGGPLGKAIEDLQQVILGKAERPAGAEGLTPREALAAVERRVTQKHKLTRALSVQARQAYVLRSITGQMMEQELHGRTLPLAGTASERFLQFWPDNSEIKKQVMAAVDGGKIIPDEINSLFSDVLEKNVNGDSLETSVLTAAQGIVLNSAAAPPGSPAATLAEGHGIILGSTVPPLATIDEDDDTTLGSTVPPLAPDDEDDDTMSGGGWGWGGGDGGGVPKCQPCSTNDLYKSPKYSKKKSLRKKKKKRNSNKKSKKKIIKKSPKYSKRKSIKKKSFKKSSKRNHLKKDQGRKL